MENPAALFKNPTEGRPLITKREGKLERKPRKQNQTQVQHGDAERQDERRNICDSVESDQNKGNQACRGHNSRQRGKTRGGPQRGPRGRTQKRDSGAGPKNTQVYSDDQFHPPQGQWCGGRGRQPNPKSKPKGYGRGGNFQEQHQIQGDFQESDQFPDPKDSSQIMPRQPNQPNERGRNFHEKQKHTVSSRKPVSKITSSPCSVDDSDAGKVADQSQFETNKILIRGLSGKTSRDGLSNFIAAKSAGQEVKDVQMLNNGKALVIMADEIRKCDLFSLDFTKIKTKCEERGLDDAKVSIEQVPVCKSILVTGFSDVTHDFIELYFESRRNGGGPVDKVDYVPKSGRAVVVFQNAKDMERVLTRHEEKPHEFEQTQLSIRAYREFLEDEEVDGAEDSGDLGATATAVSESRVSQKPDVKAQRLPMPVDPDVMEYVTFTGFQAELNNSLTGEKSEITWKPNDKIALIVYRGEDDSDSWQSECIDQVQNYLSKFAKCDVQVNKDFWEAVVAKVPSIRTCLGVDPPLVKTIPESNVARIISLKADVKSNEEKVRSKLEEIYREETRKTYLKKKIADVPKERLILLKKIKFTEKLQEKNKELEIKINTEGEEIYFEGPQPQFTKATMEFEKLMKKIVEKKCNFIRQHPGDFKLR
ncbi:unnamed protein product [Pocillopora meandrina]|uniref:RRM domain-containing protein n=1 Tax=Pocillopora meandrina TaxID=46732 RepID=A0AAU9XL41_9CNID|nr:unnamed protein product [Pocillopora meandrina]